MISFIVPIYNAEKIIPGNYEALKGQLAQMRQDYEIIFLDDASRDKSRDILDRIAKKDVRVKVFLHVTNQGLGATLGRLFREASGDILIYLDMDLPFGVEILPQLLNEISESDVVLASRYRHSRRNVPPFRQITSHLYYLLCKALFNISVRDIGSGTVVFKKEVIKNINFFSRGFDIHLEFFYKVKKKRLSIKEVPLEYRYSGYSTFSILRHGPGILLNTLKYWWRSHLHNAFITNELRNKDSDFSVTPLLSRNCGGETSGYKDEDLFT